MKIANGEYMHLDMRQINYLAFESATYNIHVERRILERGVILKLILTGLQILLKKNWERNLLIGLVLSCKTFTENMAWSLATIMHGWVKRSPCTTFMAQIRDHTIGWGGIVMQLDKPTLEAWQITRFTPILRNLVGFLYASVPLLLVFLVDVGLWYFWMAPTLRTSIKDVC